MRTNDVVLQLYNSLPQLTNRFTSFVDVQSITAAGLVATATAPGHGLQVGDAVTITDAIAPVFIDSMNRAGTIVSVVTSTDHDLTENFQTTVTIEGAIEPEFNGTFTLLTVPNRRTFTYRTADTGPIVATGEPVLLDGSAYGYNGLHSVTAATSTTFSYDLPGPVGGGARGNNIRATTEYRITGAVNLDRAIAAYTAQQIDDWWLFVILGDVVASKDRYIENDAVATQLGNTEWKQQVTQSFTAAVFAPSVNSVSARPQRDEMEDLAPLLFQSLLGVKFDTGFANSEYYSTVFVSHGSRDYNTSVYVHQFNFQLLAEITSDDTAIEPFNVAFRDIDLSLATSLMTADSERLTADINLDDEPL